MNASISISPNGNYVVITQYHADGSISNFQNEPLKAGETQCFLITFIRGKGIEDIVPIDMNTVQGTIVKIGDFSLGGGGTVIIMEIDGLIVLPPVGLRSSSSNIGHSLLVSQQMAQSYQIPSFPDIRINGKNLGVKSHYIICYSKDEYGKITISIYLLLKI